MDPQKLVEHFSMSPHPEGGFFAETYRSQGAIPADALPHIFERFYRADASRSQEIPGTGLGLSIVKHICEIHGATISVTSDPDCTVFTVVWRPGKTEAAG